MENLTAKHYLEIFKTRKEMQEAGVTNPSDTIKKLTADIVEKLQAYPPDEEIKVENNSYYDEKGNLNTT